MADVARNSTVPGLLFGVGLVAAVGAGGAQALGVAAWPLILGLVSGAIFCAAVVAHSERTGTFVTAIAAAAANAYLFTRKLEASAGDAFCNVNEVINCDAVNTSPQSEALGVPITLFGFAFYVGLALASLGNAERSRRFHQVSAMFAVFNVAYSLYLAQVSWQMGHLCVVCTFIYAANFLLLWAGVRGHRAQGGVLTEDVMGALTSRSMVTIAVTFFAIVLVGGSAWRGRPGAVPEPNGATLTQDDLAALVMQPGGPVRLAGDEPILGDPNAPYVVLEFADFGCPHCAHAEREFAALVEEMPQIQVRFRVFPLSGACNPVLQSEAGIERCLAAIGAECANEQGRFWDYARSVFKNQAYMQPEDLRFQAEQIKLDMPAWAACLARPDIALEIRDDAQAGADAGVQGTPTAYLKGTHGDAWVMVQGRGGPAAGVRKLVEAHLAGKAMPEVAPYTFDEH